MSTHYCTLCDITLMLSDRYMQQLKMPPLGQIMACCLFGAESLFKPTLFCQLNHWEQINWNLNKNNNNFVSVSINKFPNTWDLSPSGWKWIIRIGLCKAIVVLQIIWLFSHSDIKNAMLWCTRLIWPTECSSETCYLSGYEFGCVCFEYVWCYFIEHFPAMLAHIL